MYGRLNRLDEAEAALQRIRPYFKGSHQLAQAEAQIKNWRGEFGTALAFAEKSHELALANDISAGILSGTLLSLGEFERVLEVPLTDPWAKVLALKNLGRVEEATMLARDWTRTDPGLYIAVLANTARFDELVDYVETGWPSLEAMARDLKGDFGFGDSNLLSAAWAYQETGRQDKYREALRLARQEHDRQRAQGAASMWFWEAEAIYWTLAGDDRQALDFLERAVDMGYTGPPRLATVAPVFKPLEGDPRYASLQTRAFENLERQRVVAGLEPYESEHIL